MKYKFIIARQAFCSSLHFLQGQKYLKTKTDLSFVAVYVLCNYCQRPKLFSHRGNFIAVVGQHCSVMW